MKHDNTEDNLLIPTLVQWWNDNNYDICIKENWIIYPKMENIIFQSYRIYPRCIDLYSGKEKEKAKSWGWILNNLGIIIGFDEKIFESKKYLLTGYGLGLL